MKIPCIELNPPLLAPHAIAEKISCIRAHRERIFQVFVEHRADKLICHNYGHGGAGWTFLFGCVHASLQQFEHALKTHSSLKNKTITVIGAGCYGLLTAILLARRGYCVRIVARETENLMSHKAAGFFFPRPRKCSTPQEIALFHAYGLESLKNYRDIIDGKHPFITRGAQWLPAYFSPSIDPGFKPYCHDDLIVGPRDVTIDFGNGKVYEVLEYKALFINTTRMMHELQRTVQELAIPIEHRTIYSFEEVQDSIIFNCSGWGAVQLTQDKRIVPVQGHLITLAGQPSPEKLQYLINVNVTMLTPALKPRDELLYFAPKREGIIGITFLRGQDNPQANEHEFERLLERAHSFFGSNVR